MFYLVNASYDQVHAFYMNQMAAEGWTFVGQQTYGNSTTMTFERGTSLAFVGITPYADGTTEVGLVSISM